MGEHAAVYGQPALIAAADPRARVEVEDAMQGLAVELVDFDTGLETSWHETQTLAQRSREAWQRYADLPTPERFAEVTSGSPEDLVLLALGELALARGEGELPPVTIRVSSSLPIGSGFGSSASIAVALVGGMLQWLDGTVDTERVDALAMEVERRQHGLPSGVDHKTVLCGGVVLAERTPAKQLNLSKLDTSSPALEHLEVYQTGKPAETTGEVVAAVRRHRDEDRQRVDALLDRMGNLVHDFSAALQAPVHRPPVVRDLMRAYQRCLEDLGVVPASVRETIRELEAAGGGAKISGAGSLTGSSAGCLLVFWAEGPPETPPGRLIEYERQKVVLGVEGLRVEESQ